MNWPLVNQSIDDSRAINMKCLIQLLLLVLIGALQGVEGQGGGFFSFFNRIFRRPTSSLSFLSLSETAISTVYVFPNGGPVPVATSVSTVRKRAIKFSYCIRSMKIFNFNLI